MRDKSDSLTMGVDLGGTKILTAVVNSRGEMMSRDHSITPAAQGPDAVIQFIMQSMNRSLGQAGIAISDLAAIGVGVPGPSDPDAGVLFTAPNLPGWRNVPLRDIIEKATGVKSFLINDANAAALGELYFGAAQGARHFIYITISTGIGGGVIIDGKIYTGTVGTAGELGHMTIDDKGPRCNCGNTGCWETLASGTALAREARLRIKEGAATTILKHVDGDMEKITAQVIQAAAEQGDDLAKELIDRVGYYLGVGLANLLNIFNPELIVIGGGLSNIGDMLLTPAIRTAGERAFKDAYRTARFAPAKLGRNSGVLGAAAFALHEMNRAV